MTVLSVFQMKKVVRLSQNLNLNEPNHFASFWTETTCIIVIGTTSAYFEVNSTSRSGGRKIT